MSFYDFFPEFIINGVQDLWSSPTGQIFFLTVVAYYLGVTIYYGFLGKLTGRLGSAIAFGRDFSIGDFLSMFPMVMSTLIDFIIRNFFGFLQWLFVFVILPIAIGVMSNIWFPNFIKITIPGLAEFFNYITFLFATMIASFMIFSQKTIVRIILYVIQITLIPLGMYSIRFVDVTNLNGVKDLGWAFLLLFFISKICWLLIVLLFPYLLGYRMAQYALESKSFSGLSKMLLSYQIVGLGNFSISNSQSLSIKPKWFKKKEEIHLNDPVYLLEPDKDIYFIGEHRNWVLLYKDSGEKEKDNSLFMIDRDQIISMELIKQPEKEDKK